MAESVYSHGHVFVAEVVGTATMCVIGLGGIANAVLPGTKGHGIGFLGIAFCFGFGVFLPLQFIGHISGTLPPSSHSIDPPPVPSILLSIPSMTAIASSYIDPLGLVQV